MQEIREQESQILEFRIANAIGQKTNFNPSSSYTKVEIEPNSWKRRNYTMQNLSIFWYARCPAILYYHGTPVR